MNDERETKAEQQTSGRDASGDSPDRPEENGDKVVRSGGGNEAVKYILLTCGGLFALVIVLMVGCTMYFGYLGKEYLGNIERIVDKAGERSEAAREAGEISMQDAENRVNPEVTLDRLLENPADYRGDWIEVTGVVLNPMDFGGKISGGLQQDRNAIAYLVPERAYRGEIQAEQLDSMVLLRNAEGVSRVGKLKTGERVRVLGRAISVDFGQIPFVGEQLEDRAGTGVTLLLVKRAETVDNLGDPPPEDGADAEDGDDAGADEDE